MYNEDITGRRFGRLLVIKKEPKLIKHTRRWVCQCDCGAVKLFHLSNLKRNTSSCGCLKREINANKKRTHGQKGTKEYNAWQAMLSRCRGYSDINKRNYRDRGIMVCKRWLKFENFFEDMGRKPSLKHTLERKDNNKGYSKSNCEWALRIAQGRNTRRNRMIEINGQNKCLSEWCEIYNVSYGMVKRRLYRGVPTNLVFTLPKCKNGVRFSSLLKSKNIAHE